jgi:hypothetical protein
MTDTAMKKCLVALVALSLCSGGDVAQPKQQRAADPIGNIIQTEVTQQRFDELAETLPPGQARKLATWLPWLVKKGSDLWDQIYAQLDAARQAPKGGGRGGVNFALSPQRPIAAGNFRFTAGYFHADVAWMPGYPFPEGTLDVFGSPGAWGKWRKLGSVPVPDPLAGWMPVSIALPADPGWASAGFVTVANRADNDGDGLTNAEETLIHGSNPDAYSSAGDGLSDAWKVFYGIDAYTYLDPDADPDGDGLKNSEEEAAWTNPFAWDTDGDGFSDGWEVQNGTDPLDPDDPGTGQPPGSPETATLTFTVGGDYAGWDMTIEGISPGDAFTRVISTAPGEIRAVPVQLAKGRSYRITMEWTGTIAGKPEEWYCWRAKINGWPAVKTFGSGVRIPGAATCGVEADWALVNAGGLFTEEIHTSDQDTGNLAEGLEAILHVPDYIFVAPFGSPITHPEDSGIGQNQFTFSAGASGFFQMGLWVDIMPAEAAPLVAPYCKFAVGDAGFSWKQWHYSFDGAPIVSGNSLFAYVSFTGLPFYNKDFGWKLAELKFKGTRVAANPYGVFFPKDDNNHPACATPCTDDGTGGSNLSPTCGCPNWFYYWKEGGVCGIPANCYYDPSISWGRVAGDTINPLMFLGYKAALTNNGPHTFTNMVTGTIVVAGSNGKGIQCVVEVIQHEDEHIKIARHSLNKPDMDGDWIPDADEATYGGISSDPTRPDTYQLNGRFQNVDFSTSGDREIRCLLREMDRTIMVLPAKDWANPGCQHKNQFGPKLGL